MRSVRLGERLEERVRTLAKTLGQPVSEVIREAVRRYCDEHDENRLDKRLADVVGKFASEGGTSRKTGESLRENLSRKQSMRKRRSPRS